ncbi:MAG: polysaccharide deacetylase family protein [Planctomycetota bacterium]
MIVKRLARNVFAVGCRASMILRRAETKNLDQLTILCYHRVLPRDQKKQYFLPDLVVTPESFDGQCLVVRQHYDVLPLSDAFDALGQQNHPTRPLASITFDDGYQDNFFNAAPILAKHDLRATFFVVTDLIGGDSPPWYDRMGKAVANLTMHGKAEHVMNDLNLRHVVAQTHLATQVVRHAKTLAPTPRKLLLDRLCKEAGATSTFAPDDLVMNEDQLRELSSVGHEIASHSRTHEILTQLDDAELHEEIAGSKYILEEKMNRPVRSFCYPNGDVDDRVVRAVSDAGYTCATSVEVGSNSTGADRFRLRRRFIHEERLLAIHGAASDTLLRMELCGLTVRSLTHARR